MAFKLIQLDGIQIELENHNAKLDVIAKISCGDHLVEETSAEPSSLKFPSIPLSYDY